MKKSGMTLIEVMIAMAILAFLSLMTARSIQQGTRSKKKLQSTIDQRTAINNALKIIERDVNLAFHYQDFNYELAVATAKARAEAETKRQQEAAKANPGGPPVIPVEPKIPNKPEKLTHFYGESGEMHFSNLNNVHIRSGVPVSDQQEVGYFLQSCKSILDPDLSGKCLWRRSTPYIDDDITKGGNEIVLIEGVKDFSLRYFGKPKKDFVSSWRTKDSRDALTGNNFPQAVEVTLSLDWKGKTVEAVRMMALRFPNNEYKEEGGEDGQPPKGN